MDTNMETQVSLPHNARDMTKLGGDPQALFTLRGGLLLCGILSSLLYVGMNIVVPMLADEYSMASQTVSELSAIGAETRSLWVALAIPYGALVIAFGCGVWLSAGKQRMLKAVGFLLIFNSFIGFFWPPMNLRGTPPTVSDTMHIVFTVVVVLTFVLQMTLAAAALGNPFRIYTIVSILILAKFGTLTGLEAPGIVLNLPTPMIGVWERISIGAYILWIGVLAMVLLRRSKPSE